MNNSDWAIDDNGRGAVEEAAPCLGIPTTPTDPDGGLGLVGTLISPAGSSVDDDEAEDDDSDGADAASSAGATVDPEPYLSNQFYTFNQESHRLMSRCILESRYPSLDEIKAATPASVLVSWRGVWKDRNEDTAYATGWKRIQDKLGAAPASLRREESLFFKNNPNQLVPHVQQWQEIAVSCHSKGPDSKHLGLKETIDRIKQVWTVGAKFYGIPEAFIRACLLNCAVCRSEEASGGQGRSKRRRFKYTDTFEVPAKEVPQRLQQLAAKHKVVLCIRQKYIRYKPFMAEVKDYCCHRAGEPNMKKPGVLQRKRYISKRCGCGFRIRAIVPIKDYNQKDKSFTYEDDGKAVFNLYAVHSGHEPGPHEGSARIIHRFVGPANLAIERGEIVCMGTEGADGACFSVTNKVDGHMRLTVSKQIEELKAELGTVISKIPCLPEDTLLSLSQELLGISQKLRSIREASECDKMIVRHHHQDSVFLDDPNDLDDWGDRHEIKSSIVSRRLMNDSDGHDFLSVVGGISHEANSSLRAISGGLSSAECAGSLKLLDWSLPVKEPCEQFSSAEPILSQDEVKSCKDPHLDATHDMSVNGEDENLVGMNVDGYDNESIRWYLDPSPDCGDNLSIALPEGLRHAIV
ncbi:uncharacterized protein LOC116249114 [Nymphaea colorata]|nr:uncharacterized protein LOC116249114 [Nymphaea colorata]